MDNRDRIRSVSRKFEMVCTALLVLTPLSAAAYWAFFNHLPEEVLRRAYAVDVRQTQPAYVLLMGFCASMLPVGVCMYALFTLRRLFALYRKGMIFTAQNVSCFRRLGVALLMWVGACTLYEPMTSVILTLINGPGNRTLTLGFSSDDVTMLLLGGVALLISWVMDEGRRLEEEQALTV